MSAARERWNEVECLEREKTKRKQKSSLKLRRTGAYEATLTVALCMSRAIV
jgi:hypothetical protein